MPSIASLLAVLSLAVMVALSVLLTDVTRRYALRKGLLDLPNERSSHLVPTVRGGGLAIAITFLGAVAFFAISGAVSTSLAAALLGGGTLVAVTGWVDDHRHVAAGWRLLAQFAAAGWALYCLGGLPQLQLGDMQLVWGWPGQLLTLVGMVWLSNLYNFMDGSDGLAASQAVCAGLGGGLLLLLAHHSGLALCSLALAAASSGFLLRNWPPARIFMGDVGSGLIGFSFAVLAVASEKSGALPLLAWLLLLSFFIFDASYTLCRRAVRREPLLQAHRSHAYQRLIQAGRSHRWVVILLVLLNVLVFWPLAWLTSHQSSWAPFIVITTGVACWLVWYWVQINHRRSAADP